MGPDVCVVHTQLVITRGVHLVELGAVAHLFVAVKVEEYLRLSLGFAHYDVIDIALAKPEVSRRNGWALLSSWRNFPPLQLVRTTHPQFTNSSRDTAS